MVFSYNLLKFLHVTAIIVWIGGVVAVAILNVWLARSDDRAVRTVLVRQSVEFGGRVIGPSAGIALLMGIILMVVGRLGMPFWILWGFVALVVSMAISSTAIRRTGVKLAESLAAADAADTTVASLQSRLATLSIINLVILLSAVWMMVFKPAL